MFILTYTETLHQSQVLKEDAVEPQLRYNQNISLRAYVHATKPLKTANLENRPWPLCRGTSFVTSCPHSGRTVVPKALQGGNEGEVTATETPGSNSMR